MKKELINHLEDLLLHSDQIIDDAFIDTTYRWLLGNRYGLLLDEEANEITEAEFAKAVREIYEYITLNINLVWN